jgi:hypothetical protein
LSRKLTKIKRAFYQKNPIIWMRDRLGVEQGSLDWALSDIGAYQKTGRLDEEGNIVADAWDGTPNPFKVTMDAIATGWKQSPPVRGAAIESGTGTGKTYLAALAVLWFLDVYGDPDRPKDGCKVVTFAPTEDQLKDHMWTEIDTLWPKFKLLHPRAERLKLEIRMPDYQQEGKTRDNWNAKGDPVGVKADEQSATKAQGIHAKHLLIILEETPGINPAVLTAVDNTMTAPHNVLLALGNPDSIHDPLHDLFTRSNIESVRCSSLDHPNVVLEDPDYIPGAVSQASVDNMLVLYKEKTHPMYMSRVQGICPDTVAQCLFRPNALVAAKKHLLDPIEVIDLNGPITEGQIKIYFERAHTHLNRYLVFADPAGDAGNRDWHAAIVMDRIRKRPAAVLHMRGPRNEFVKALLQMCELYKVQWTEMSLPDDPRFYYAMLNWERRGVGALSMSEDVVAYPAIYYSRNIEVPDANLRAAMGWDTNSKTRKDMINALEEWGLSLFDAPYTVVDKDLFEELKTFVWVPKGTQGNGRFEHAKGKNDDLVMAWAGCLMTDMVIGPVVQQLKPESVNINTGPFVIPPIPRQKKRSKDTWDRARIPEKF